MDCLRLTLSCLLAIRCLSFVSVFPVWRVDRGAFLLCMRSIWVPITVGMAGCARGVHIHPLASYFLVRCSTAALRILNTLPLPLIPYYACFHSPILLNFYIINNCFL